MESRLLDKNEDKKTISFALKGTDVTFANLLRRYILDKVYTMAIEEVEFKEHSSALYDEMVAHRLGLIPLSTDLKSYDPIKKCKCGGEGCNRCTLKLTLKADGPKTVYASEIKSKDPKVKPIYPKMPIVKILKDQKIEILATAVLGQGEDHVKFSPGFAFYKLKPEVKVAKSVKNAEQVAKNCPVQVFDLKNGDISVNRDNMMNCHLCNQCLDIVDPKGAIEIENGPDVIFEIESWGQLSCKEIVLAALEEYEKDLSEFENLFKKE